MFPCVNRFVFLFFVLSFIISVPSSYNVVNVSLKFTVQVVFALTFDTVSILFSTFPIWLFVHVTEPIAPSTFVVKLNVSFSLYGISLLEVSTVPFCTTTFTVYFSFCHMILLYIFFTISSINNTIIWIKIQEKNII